MGEVMGRHSPTHHVPRWVGALLAGLLVVATVSVAQDQVGQRSMGMWSDPAAGPCARTLQVLTATSFAPVLHSLAGELGRGDDCVRVEVEIANGRAAPSRVAQADVWIPDDASWATTAHATGFAPKGTAGAQTVLATSPIFMVGDPTPMDRVRQAGDSWLGLAGLLAGGSGLRLAIGDPAASGTGLVAAGVVGEAVWMAKGMDASALALSKIEKVTRTEPDAAATLPTRYDEIALVSENVLLAALPRLPPDVEIRAGTDHSAMLRFTWLPTAAAVADPARVAALDRLRDALTGPSGARAIQAARLRGPDTAELSTRAAVDRLPEVSAPPFGVLGEHHVDHVFATWYAGDRQMSLLIVTDVSGSMAEPAEGSSISRIDLVKRGCRTVGDLLPDDARIGLWEFGSHLDPPRDHRTLLPPDRLTGSQRAALDQAVGALAARRTGTGLYNTILDAYVSARDTYQAEVPNQVLLFTDGRNEDAPDSITIGQLTQRLAQAKDPDRPVQLTVVTFGQLPDADGLRDAIKPVNGYLDPLRTPEDVEAAFIHVTAGGLHGP
jgi:hypothetical protein